MSYLQCLIASDANTNSTELSFESSPYHSKDASANASNDELLLGHGANHWTAYEWLATQLKDLAAPNSLMPYLRSALLPESHPDTNELLAIPDDIRRSTHITQLDPDICSQLCCPAASLYAASETDETFHVWVVVEDELHAFYGWEEQSTPARDGGDEVAQDIKADMSYGDRG